MSKIRPTHWSAWRVSRGAPTPEQVRSARMSAKLTQKEAAKLVWGTESGWQKHELGQRRMKPIIFAAFLTRCGLSSFDSLELPTPKDD